MASDSSPAAVPHFLIPACSTSPRLAADDDGPRKCRQTAKKLERLNAVRSVLPEGVLSNSIAAVRKPPARKSDVNATAGYSGTPLAVKLGIKEGSTLALVQAPPGILQSLPSGVTVQTTARGTADVVVAFFTARAELERRADALGAMVFPDGGLWIAWPKKSSGVATDLGDEAVREVVLPYGLVDNKVCAIDETWSGLRMVWRRTLRGDNKDGK